VPEVPAKTPAVLPAAPFPEGDPALSAAQAKRPSAALAAMTPCEKRRDLPIIFEGVLEAMLETSHEAAEIALPTLVHEPRLKGSRDISARA
jgi:hypothetical protein